MELCLAVDIGGTKMSAALIGRDGVPVSSATAPTPSTLRAQALFDSLDALIASVMADRPAPIVCGVGCGGPMTKGAERVSPLNIPAWRDFPLRSRLAQATRLPTFVDNDGKALALAEGWLGAASGLPDFLAMVVSTGVGGGIVLDGRLLEGSAGNAGHIGHVLVEPQGRLCGCGAHGCLEAEASGTAITASTGRPAREAGPETVERTGRMVGRAVASVCSLLDLELTVVAGSVALGFGTPFFAAAERELEERSRLDFTRGARIVPGGLGAAGPIVGAAAVGWRGLDRQAPRAA